ncbi:Hpt domain-containing protein [Mangrovimonas spongiae]|uniref:Hpt domain-containing protein n=1 Tax=Mangrovimonas spongiae TaxID=2494697 RepID=A0A428JWU4_9FLAO|nr:Hpt domain-containing protein [Mangrovimonas spongiae]RSK38667.1 Hpt domain-containing protein [Mangrovimonas spongiae]
MVDLSFLEKFTKGNTKKMQRYIKLYLDVAPQTFEQMQQNLKDKDWEQLRINAHSLKPQTDFVGIHELKGILIAIEEAVKKNNYSVLESLFKQAKTLNQESVIQLKVHLNEF